MELLREFLIHQPVLVFFIVLSLGYLVGNIRLFGISLGSVGGVLLVGLLFGHLGFSMDASMQTMGFVLFIFCVGYQAGPQFFDVLLTSGLKYLSLALVVAITAFTLSMGLSRALDLAPGMGAGLLGGAITSTPTLAAAQDAVRSGLVETVEGVSTEQILTNIGAGYALTYLFGLIGLILIIKLLPVFLGLDLADEAAKVDTGADRGREPDLSRITQRVYRITQKGKLDRSIRELELSAPRDVSITALRREGELIRIDHDTRLEVGDEVLVIGSLEHLLQNAPKVGVEIADAEGLGVEMKVAHVVVTNPKVVGEPINEIRLDERIGALPIEVRRQRTSLPLSGDLILHRGDVITIYGPDFAIDRMAQHVGHVERGVTETDLFTFALGVAAGIGLGSLTVSIGNISVGLGMAGGLLITGLVIGFLRSIWPIFGRVPSAARWVFMEFGLLMFMAGVGINAGGGIVDVVHSAGPELIGAGVIVTIIPVLVGYSFSRKILNLNPAEALGGVTGAMTSGAALSVVTDVARSNVPALGYTGAYAFANVILTVAGTLFMLL
jgi:putative transport protein